MNSNQPSNQAPLDLEHDVPTTQSDIEALRRLRVETPSWLLLPPEAIDALLPSGALDRRPATSPRATPFELP